MVKKFRNNTHEELYKKFISERNEYFVSLGKEKFNDAYRGHAFYFSEGIKIHDSMNEELHPEYFKILKNIKNMDAIKKSDVNHGHVTFPDKNESNNLEDKVSEFPFQIRLISESIKSY